MNVNETTPLATGLVSGVQSVGDLLSAQAEKSHRDGVRAALERIACQEGWCRHAAETHRDEGERATAAAYVPGLHLAVVAICVSWGMNADEWEARADAHRRFLALGGPAT